MVRSLWFSRPRIALAAAMVVFIGGAAGCDPEPLQVGDATVSVKTEQPGYGTREAEAGDRVCVSYAISLPSGEVVIEDDHSCFTIGAGSVIDGLDRAVRGMRAGGSRTVSCPPHLHWGRAGYGPIPPRTTLTLRVTLTKIS